MNPSRLVALWAVLAACSSAAHSGSPTTLADGGSEARAGVDAPVCTAGDVWCGGLCVQESVAACGVDCNVCGQPAASHGMADCTDGQCAHACQGGYTPCGRSGCCGAATDGDMLAVAVGGSTSCGITVAGAVSCWGDGSYGTLGNGAVQVNSTTPVGVNGLGSQAASLSVGDRHACAVTTGGTLSCWGDDQEGQLGDGGRTPRSDPVSPFGLVAVVARVAAGATHTCAVTTTGAAKCWGDNSYGQLGNGTTSASLTPSDVQGLAAGVVAIAAGRGFTCALETAGNVKCWGDGGTGQLGGQASSSKPVDIALGSTAKAVAAGARHACALTTAGALLCWGADDVNQLGDGGSVTPRTRPVQVPGAGAFGSVSAGGDETCAVDQAGAVRCWGADPVGDVGPGPAGPAVVPSLKGGVASVAVVAGHACAVMLGGAPKCWGANATGQLGDGTTIDSWVPVDVEGI